MYKQVGHLIHQSFLRMYYPPVEQCTTRNKVVYISNDKFVENKCNSLVGMDKIMIEKMASCPLIITSL